MARLNRAKPATPPVYTHEGAKAKHISPEQELKRSVLACMLFEDNFYEDGQSVANRIDNLAMQISPEKVAELAIYARSEANLRHVPLRLLLALVKRNYTDIANVIAKVIQRPDELGELLVQYGLTGEQRNVSLDNQLKKGLKLAFEKFNDYQLAKYQGHDRLVTLRDVMFLVRPNPVKAAASQLLKQKAEGKLIAQSKLTLLQETYRKLADNELAAPEIWEKQLSEGGDKKEVFTQLIKENKLGALAMLRNLRNMTQASVDESIIRQGLSQMKTERVLPFRFITASRYAPKFEPELEKAMLQNLELEDKLSGKTVLLVDISGSMEGQLSGKSELKRLDAATGVAVLLREICETIEIYSFTDSTKLVPARRGFGLIEAINRSQTHGSTYLGAAVTKANSIGYDRLVVISDEQSADRVPDPVAKAYMINVASYQNGVGYQGNWTHISGFSESVVKWIQSYESLVF